MPNLPPFEDEDEPPYEDDWFDDDPVWVKEEPNCPACNDSGGRCCEPTKLDILRWRLSSWFRLQLAKLRRRRANYLDEPPF